jgi:hypothetical protein
MLTNCIIGPSDVAQLGALTGLRHLAMAFAWKPSSMALPPTETCRPRELVSGPPSSSSAPAIPASFPLANLLTNGHSIVVLELKECPEYLLGSKQAATLFKALLGAEPGNSPSSRQAITLEQACPLIKALLSFTAEATTTPPSAAFNTLLHRSRQSPIFGYLASKLRAGRAHMQPKVLEFLPPPRTRASRAKFEASATVSASLKPPQETEADLLPSSVPLGEVLWLCCREWGEANCMPVSDEELAVLMAARDRLVHEMRMTCVELWRPSLSTKQTLAYLEQPGRGAGSHWSLRGPGDDTPYMHLSRPASLPPMAC